MAKKATAPKIHQGENDFFLDCGLGAIALISYSSTFEVSLGAELGLIISARD